MQPSHYLSIVVSGSAEHAIQERIRDAEKHALIKAARGRRPSVIASIRFAVGQFMVGFGRRVAGRPRREQRPIEAPGAFRIAR
jgi:hypothetical protein